MIDINHLNNLTQPLREKAKRILIIHGVIISFCLLQFLFISPTYVSRSPFFFIVMFVSLIVGIFQYTSVRKQYSNIVKKELVEGSFKQGFENLLFDPERPFDKGIIHSMALIPLGNRYYSNDYVSATHNGINFSRADVHTEQVTTNGKNTTTVTLFKGQVYQFSFNKISPSHIKIQEQRFLGSRKRGLEKLEFENQEFNDIFITHTDNPHDAFYIFTPHFMERLIKFRRFLQSRMHLVVDNDKLYLALETNRDSFEPKLSREIDQEYINALNKDIEIINIIIDELDLENTIFTPSQEAQ